MKRLRKKLCDEMFGHLVLVMDWRVVVDHEGILFLEFFHINISDNTFIERNCFQILEVTNHQQWFASE